MKNPFRTLRTNTATIAALEVRLTDLEAKLTNQAALISLLTATDTVLERIAKATEYLRSVEAHRQKNAGQRHEF